MKEQVPLVSIILPVYTQEQTIEQCIQSLLTQDYPRKELIIVDDGSTDGTPKIIEKYKGLAKVVRTVHSGRSSARNVGLRNSSGEIVFFAEADAIYDQNFLKKVAKRFENPHVGGVIGRMQILTTGKFLPNCLQAEREIVLSNYKPFSAWVYRRDSLQQAGGFDERLECSEDRDLAKRVEKAGFSIAYEPEANWWHKAPGSLGAYLKRSFWNGKEKVPYSIKNREAPYRQLLFSFVAVLILTFTLSGLVSLGMFLAIVVIAFTVKFAYTVKKGFKCVSKRWYLIFIPPLSFLRATAFSIGFLLGLLTYNPKRT